MWRVESGGSLSPSLWVNVVESLAGLDSVPCDRHVTANFKAERLLTQWRPGSARSRRESLGASVGMQPRWGRAIEAAARRGERGLAGAADPCVRGFVSWGRARASPSVREFSPRTNAPADRPNGRRLPARPVAWVVPFPDDRSYTIRFDGERWSRHRGEADADVVVETSPEGWVRFLAADRDGRRRWLDRSRVKGTSKRVDELASAFGPGRASNT